VRELILTFHGLGNTPSALTSDEQHVWVPVEWFEAILDALPPTVGRVTFDDGNVSDVEHALPILARDGRVASFFVPAANVGKPHSMTEQDLVRLHGEGMVVGSHGLRHRDWRTATEDELHEELVGARDVLAEKLGAPVEEAACPFGSYDRRVLRAARSVGYRRIYTSDGGASSTRAWLAPRTTIHRGWSLERWLEFVASGPSTDLFRSAKRLGKRIR